MLPSKPYHGILKTKSQKKFAGSLVMAGIHVSNMVKIMPDLMLSIIAMIDPGNYEVCVKILYFGGCEAKKCEVVKVEAPGECRVKLFQLTPSITSLVRGFFASPWSSKTKDRYEYAGIWRWNMIRA
jgi:hypothetical protein